MKNSTLHIFTIWAFCHLFCIAQNNCNDANCLTNTLIINTGYNHQTNSAYQLTQEGMQDPFWILTNAPSNGGPVTINAPAYMIEYNSSSVQSNSNYISAYATNNKNLGNLVGSGRPPYSFEHCFCVCQDNTVVTYDFNIHVDNQVAMFLERPIGADVPLNKPTAVSDQLQTTTTDNFTNPPEKLTGTLILNSGKYCIRAELRNAPSSQSESTILGLNISGTLKTQGNKKLQKGACCNNRGFIVGYKYKDNAANQNGLPGWQIKLTGQGLNQTVTTDIHGYYAFTVAPGTYTISEVLQSGWNPITPVGGTKSIVVTPNSISQIDFVNCETPKVSLTQEITCCSTKINLTGSGYTGSTWSNGQVNTNSISVTQAGTYTVSVTSSCGSSTASITVAGVASEFLKNLNQVQNQGIYYSSTSNQNSYNAFNIWHVENPLPLKGFYYATKYRLEIWDRWGAGILRVIEKDITNCDGFSNFSIQWDGTIGGQQVQSGFYNGKLFIQNCLHYSGWIPVKVTHCTKMENECLEWGNCKLQFLGDKCGGLKRKLCTKWQPKCVETKSEYVFPIHKQD